MRRKNISIYKHDSAQGADNLDMITRFDSSYASRYARALSHLHVLINDNNDKSVRGDEIASNYIFEAMNLTQDELSHNSPWSNRNLVEAIEQAISSIMAISCLKDDPTKHLDTFTKQCEKVTELVRAICTTNRTSTMLLLILIQAIELGLNEQSDSTLDLSAEDLFSAALNLCM